tara:strand:- start:16535 stop:17476 length:942 start_codon:yes stop_codon:yes gene_type:complete
MNYNKEDIIESHNRISKWIHRTPIHQSSSINKIAGAEIYFKCENFQKIGAFKMRGALNAVMSTKKQNLKKGFVTHSSGNHAQAVALSSNIANTKAYIVMPKGAPKIKIKAVRGYGAEVTLCENNEDSRVRTCNKIIKEKGANFIHPFDNDDVILGQSTCAKEIYEELPDLDYIISPVGGGGLASGTILSTKFFSENTKVVLAEPQKANDAFESFINKRLIPVSNPNTIADGLKTSLSEKTFKIILDGTDQIVTIEEEEIVNSMKLIWERLKIVCEPSCSLPLAAVLKNKEKFKGKKIGLILTGGNIDVSNLPF